MFDGVAGALIGAVVGGLMSLVIATLVLRRTRRDNEDLARQQASLAAAQDLGMALHSLLTEMHGLRGKPDKQALAMVQEMTEAFEREVILHAPSLRQTDLRDAMEEVIAVLRNFGHFAFSAGGLGQWKGLKAQAFVQAADYVLRARNAVVQYRQGEPVELAGRPGWRLIKGRWAWRIAPGVHFDGSGEPWPGWAQVDDEDFIFWVDVSSPQGASGNRPT